MAEITPSSTVGPYYLIGLKPSAFGGKDTIGNNLVTPDVSGDRIRIEGRIFDGDGQPIPDAVVEIWQADAAGRYAHPRDREVRPNATFRGFGRSDTDAQGKFSFETIKPGIVLGPEGRPQAPHIAVNVFARGMLKHATTRIYFSDESRNGEDPILALVPPERRATLIAQRDKASDAPVYRFDIHLQGDAETVFFSA
jgi:protocatechuate 3,4-dioxygenase alpha subunit